MEQEIYEILSMHRKATLIDKQTCEMADALMQLFNEAENATGQKALSPTALLDAAKTLCAKMDKVCKSDEYESIWAIAYVHTGDYKGDNWKAEYDALKAEIEKASNV